MTDKQIRTFLAVADNLSFSAAAEQLYLSQQAVTRQIAALEGEVGARLFHRTTRSVSLTPAGQIFWEEFLQINQQAQTCMAKIRSLGTENTAVLNLGIFEHFSRRKVIFPLMTQLTQAFPEIYFDLKLLDFAQLRGHLADRRVDLCVTTSSDWKYWPDTKITVCRKKPFEVVYSRRLGIPENIPFSTQLLKDYPQLTLPSQVLIRGQDAWSRRIPFLRYQPCPDLPTLVIRMEAGQGFALLTRVFEGADSPNLIFQTLDDPDAHAEIVCAVREDCANPKLEPVIRYIEGFFKNLQLWPPDSPEFVVNRTRFCFPSGL